MAVELGLQTEPYTVEDVLEQFPEDKRVELLEGALILPPFARARHRRVADAVCRALDYVVPPGVLAITNLDLRLDARTLLAPDVVVTTIDLSTDPVFVDPPDVLAVVEVVSPSSGSHDRLVKAHRYATAGIGCYWRVELQAFPGHDGDVFPVIVVHELVRGEGSDENVYREVARLTAGAVGATELPFPVELDPADLLR